MSGTLEMNEITGSLPEITAIRRDIHAHPELGFQEVGDVRHLKGTVVVEHGGSRIGVSKRQ